MADQNEIGIDLRLRTQQLGKDAADAGRQIKAGLASSVKGLGETSIEREDRIKAEQKRRETIARRQRNAALDEADAKRDQQRRAKAWEAFEKDSDRRKADADGRRSKMLRVGQSLMAGVGLGVPGLGAIAGLAQLNPAAAIATAGLRAFGAVLAQVNKSAEEARRNYAKALTSGFGMGFTINRSLLAKVIGVSEEEVYQFGGAVGYLNAKLQHATEVFTDTNPILTKLSWETKVLSEDFAALFAKLSADAAPAILGFIESLDKMIKWFTDHSEFFTDPLGKNREQEIEKQAVEFANQQAGGGPGLPFTDQRKKWNEAHESKLAELTKNGPAQEGVPPPVAFMKQMKASQWERMGLIVGSGGGTNYNKNTADNTKRANELLQNLPKELAGAFRSYMGHNVNNNIPAIP